MLKSKALNIIVDTNIWISFLISNNINSLDDLLLTEKIRLLFSTELFEEIDATIKKPKLKKFLVANAFSEILSHFEDYITLVEVVSTVSICRDPKDNFLLALAKDSKADYLLTGDKDLISIIKFGRTNIVTLSDFLEIMKDDF